jgi:hypothetical protein
MRTALDPRTAERLAKICGRLGSDHDGERAAAALLVTRALHGAGVTWDDVFTPPTSSASPRTAPRAGEMPHRLKAVWALQYPHMLSSWEAGFLQSLCRQRRASTHQLNKLDEIVAELRARGAV